VTTTDQGTAVGGPVTGADRVVTTLADSGVTEVFGIPGGHNLDLFDSLARCGSIRTFVPRHEQGAGFMADGYARVSGDPGVCMTLEGPGVLNLATSLGEAYADHSPMLVITSQLRRDSVDRGLGMIHELRSQTQVLSPMTLWSARAESAQDAEGLVGRALRELRAGRSGPIHIEVPLDILSDPVPPDPAPLAPPIDERPLDDPPLDADAVQRFVDRLRQGPRPVIWAGAGVNRSGASARTRELAERLGAPVIMTALGKGSFPESHPLHVATLSLWSPWISEGPIARLVAAADPLIVLGARLSDASTNDWRMPLPDSIVQVDIEPARAHPRHDPDVTVRGDIDGVLAHVLDGLGQSDRSRPREDLASMRVAVLAHAARGLGWGVELFGALQTVLGPDTIVMGDSLIGLWAATAWRSDRPRGYHVPMHFNTLGFALPAAIGARTTGTSDPIVAIAGEGAFMFTMAELGTAVQYELPLIVVVCNDRAYTSIKRQQVTRFEGRTLGVDLLPPDLPRFAESMGALGMAAEDGPTFRRALERAAAADRPALIEVPLSVLPPWEP
jgi:thiamine pyrophosphate-dependent acetolactate synthase large subunit-like protein